MDEDTVSTLAILQCAMIEACAENEQWVTVYHAYQYVLLRDHVTPSDSRLISIAANVAWSIGRIQERV